LRQDDPAALAVRYLAHAVRRLHVVDLDGARSGRPENPDPIPAARGAEGEGGGGLGPAALGDPGLVREAARRHPGRIAVGIDAKGGRVAVQAWTEASDVPAIELARRFAAAGVAAIVYTDIGRDGPPLSPT